MDSFCLKIKKKFCLIPSRFLRDELNGQNQELVSLRSDINKIISKAETGNSVTGNPESGNSETEVKKKI
jgi:hypothetical protein